MWACGEKGIADYYSLSTTHTKRLYDYSSLVSRLHEVSVNDFIPKRGDIIVFDWSGREDPKHVFSHAGVVTEIQMVLEAQRYYLIQQIEQSLALLATLGLMMGLIILTVTAGYT